MRADACPGLDEKDTKGQVSGYPSPEELLDGVAY